MQVEFAAGAVNKAKEGGGIIAVLLQDASTSKINNGEISFMAAYFFMILVSVTFVSVVCFRIYSPAPSWLRFS